MKQEIGDVGVAWYGDIARMLGAFAPEQARGALLKYASDALWDEARAAALVARRAETLPHGCAPVVQVSREELRAMYRKQEP